MKNLWKLSFAAAATVALLLSAGCSKTATQSASSAAGSKSDKNIVINYGYQPGHAQVSVADQLGYFNDEFAKDGITVKLQKFASGPSLISALTAGQLDFGQVGALPAIAAKANNVDIQAVGSYVKSNKITGLIALKKSGITKIADIKGKKIGVTVGSSGQELLYIYLNAAKLKPTDIQQVNLQPGDIVSSLTSGNIDAAVTWEPYLSMTVSRGLTNLVANGEGYKQEVDVIIAKGAFLKAHPSVAARVLKTLQKSATWIQNNKTEALTLTAKDAGLSASVLEPTLDKADLDVNLTSGDIASLSQTEKFLKTNAIIRRDVNIKALVNTSYLKKAGIK